MTHPEPAIGPFEAGETLWNAQLAAATDQDFAGPSLLPGWDRAHVIGHLAGNAQALMNLIAWAATGEVTLMYPDSGFRARQIEEYAALPADKLRALCRDASTQLLAAWRSLPREKWDTQVRSAQGRDIPVSEICWMRSRETHIHAVDLGEGLQFADLDTSFLDPLLVDVCQNLSAKGAPALELRDDQRAVSWRIGEQSAAETVTVTGPTAALAQWACGRGASDSLTSTSGALPPLPPWL